MKGLIKTISLTVLALLIVVEVLSQKNRSTLTGAYVYNIARYVQWPEQAISDSFSMMLVSANVELISEFKTFSSVRKINNSPIKLNVCQKFVALNNLIPNLVFISKDQLGSFDLIYKTYREYPVLIVTENLKSRSLAMINLYESEESKLVFEVNKANIITHNLSVHPELLLSGGTEIDVAELYRSQQQELENEQQKIEQLNDSLIQLKQVIISSLEQLASRQDDLKRQKQLLLQQEMEISAGKEQILRQNQSINSQLAAMAEQEMLLKEQKKSIEEQKTELSEQKSFNEIQQAEIQKSKQTLDNLAGEIVKKNTALSEQSEVISRQKQIMILSIATVAMALVILILLWISYLGKKKRNEMLQKQKMKIEEAHNQIKATNKSLFNTLTQLKEAQSQLVSSEKMASLGVLTAGIAHEINNPVNFIYTGINSLKKDYNDLAEVFGIVNRLEPGTDNALLIEKITTLKEQYDFDEILEIIPQTIEDIKTGAERAAEIIRGLRNFSRIDKDAMTLADVHEGIESALLLLRNKFKLHIRIEKNYGSIPMIECYPGKLNQAFLNLLSNAIDAIENEGIIKIGTSSVGEWIIVSIADTGKGIPPENIDKIFDPFFTTKSVGKGVGLGLSITFGIIKEHGGKIEVKSELNHGTEFSIFLPCSINK